MPWWFSERDKKERQVLESARSETVAVDAAPARSVPQVPWRQVGVFLVLAFGLSWLLDLILWRAGGLRVPAATLTLQARMLLPAFSALVLGMFYFTGSPLYFRTEHSAARLYLYFYLFLTVVYIALALASLANPELLAFTARVTLVLLFLGLVMAIVTRFVAGRPACARLGLAGAPLKYWFLYGAGLVLFYILQTALNYVFSLGKTPDLAALLPPGSTPSLSPLALRAALSLNTVVVGPFLGLVLAFGEEYGWRGYLQSELVKIGRVKGVLALGVIWGLWHAPIILMGYNYPGYPVLGVILMIFYTTGLSFFFGYAVLKTGSIWLAAYLHALNNQVLAYLAIAVYAPKNPAFSFGIGLPGLLLLGLAVLLILRDPLWREGKAEESYALRSSE
jgi:membrane protease YdiL (CAAX protease family)